MADLPKVNDDQLLAMLAGVWRYVRGTDHACTFLDIPSMASRARILVTKARKRGDKRFPLRHGGNQDSIPKPAKPTEGDSRKALTKAFSRETTTPANSFAAGSQVPAGGYRSVIRRPKFVDPTLSLPERRA